MTELKKICFRYKLDLGEHFGKDSDQQIKKYREVSEIRQLESPYLGEF